LGRPSFQFIARWRFRSVRLTRPILGVTFLVVSLAAGTGPAADSGGRAELAAVLGPARPLEGRLAGLQFARHESTSSANRQLLGRLTKRRMRAIPGRTETLADAALLEILAGRLERAASLLTRAAHQVEDPHILSDLAAVRLALGEARRDPYEIVLALVSAERARQLAVNLPEATFNRALALEKLALREESARAWRLYLRQDSSSPWASEVQVRLQKLGAPTWRDRWRKERPRLTEAILRRDQRTVTGIVRQYPQAARVFAEEELFAEWAENLRAGDESGAERTLALITALGSALETVSGDRLVAASAAALASASGRSLADLVAGHTDFAHGLALWQRLDLDRSRSLLARASARLRRGGSPFAAWADLYVAACDYQRKEASAVLRATASLGTFAARRSYPNLLGRAAWLTALVHLERGEPSRALAQCRRAVAQFESTGELGHLAQVEILTANALSYLGEPRESWKHRYRGLHAAIRSGDPDRLPVLFGEAARALARDGQPLIGLLFQNEALAREREMGDPLSVAEALWWRSMLFQRLGENARALDDVAEARRQCASIASADIRDRTLAGLAVTEGTILRQEDPARAIPVLTNALSLYRTQDYRFFLVDLFRERALAQAALGAVDAAATDFANGILEYERQRRSIDSPLNQISFFDQAQSIFDEMVALEMRRGRTEEAFAYAERGRARRLLDELAQSGSAGCGSYRSELRGRPLTPGEIRLRLPAETVLVEYSLLADRAFAWIVHPQALHQVEIRADRASLARLVDHHRRWTRGAGGDPRAAERLFDLLFSSFLDKLPSGSRLILVPDKELQALPFASLRNPRTGRYLIEDFTLVIAPSASIYVHSHALPSDRPSTAPRTALVLAPGRVDSKLSALPGAEDEARQVAAMFPGSTLLLGNDATASRLLSRAGDHDILHFAGHARVHPAAPFDAKLILASADGRGGVGEVYARDLYGLNLCRTKLVALSACGTSTGALSPLEGTLDLARPFLGAGSSAVLATLWDVQDGAARRLMVEFYSFYMKTNDPATALRSAQLALRESPDPALRRPAAWAPFQLIGTASADHSITR
jgi:CHAT domain-containing protein